MKVIIAGSRNIFDYSLVERAVKDSGFNITEEVCGSAHGIDELGKQWASTNGIPCTVMPADWVKEGISAGPKRNHRMASYADALILIWDGKSRGSASMKKEMMARNKPIYEVVVKGE